MDREKVIKQLENDAIATDTGYVEVPLWLFSEIIAMLKEQETTMVIESENMYTGLPITHCPKCGVALDRFLYGRQHEGQINYCPMCGQAIKWE
jgi:predicted RNA-binding Zn-ribbon protein involved in translation (DUF1610 family)